MKQITHFFSILLIGILVTSCEKVIDVNINDASKKYVIEGILTNQAGTCEVKISQTKNFDETNHFEGISGADVRIVDEEGVATILSEKTKGIYQSSLTGEPGKKYILQVNINGADYTAASQMPLPVSLDSLYISEMDMMGDKEKLINVVFNDPSGKGNAYRFVSYLNGKKEQHFFIQNDDLSNGRLTTTTLFTHDNKINDGDTITVEMQGIDPGIYKYWYSLSRSTTGEDGSASPANPVTNITGGALGYFSAHSITTKSIIVQ